MSQRNALRPSVATTALVAALAGSLAAAPAAPHDVASAFDVDAHVAEAPPAPRRADLRESAELLRQRPDHPLFDTKTIDGTLYVEMIGRGSVPPDRIEALALRFRGSPANDVFTASVPVDRLDELLAVDTVEDLFFSTRLPR